MRDLQTDIVKEQTRLNRRTLLLMGFATTLITSCVSHPIHGLEQRKAALRALGFTETTDGWELNLSVKLLFSVDSANLSAQGLSEISRIAPALEEIGIESLRVDGHTDNVGTDDYNLDLSLRRARTVSRELRRNGLVKPNINVSAIGKDRPVATNDTPEGRHQNRRVVLIISAL